MAWTWYGCYSLGGEYCISGSLTDSDISYYTRGESNKGVQEFYSRHLGDGSGRKVFVEMSSSIKFCSECSYCASLDKCRVYRKKYRKKCWW